MILIIDNYDSFTYNIYQYVGSNNPLVQVIKNDSHSLKEIIDLNPQKIILSPGPGTPNNSGITKEVIEYFFDKIPILGICLGHQTINEVFGGKTIHAKKLVHGKSSNITITETSPIFKGIDNEFQAARYHSLSIDPISIPKSLKITSIAEQGQVMEEIMSIEHIDYPVFGVQFHPESILTPCGKNIIENFLAL